MSDIEVPLSALKKTNSVVDATKSLPIDKSIDINTRRVGIATMGCKVNAYESELISEALKSDNWITVSAKQKADLYIVNTCTVTQEADRQARREVRKAVKNNPEALVVVTGCYAQMDSEACAKIPGVDLVVGNDKKLDIHELLPQLEKGELPRVLVGDLDEHVSLPNELLAGYEAQTRAFIQIQQGCDQGCTFCIIHRARGPSRSLAPTLIKRQVEKLAMNGYPEIVICGVDLGSYGEDFSDSVQQYDLVDLLSELLEIQVENNPDFRIRLSSIDPVHISDQLIELISAQPRVCKHIHLSLQSGNTLILKRMKRRYTREKLYETINKLRFKVPDLVMSADVMVGFPTEEEDHFLETQQALLDLDIAFPHIFTYSNRSGTPAEKIPNNKQIDSKVKKERAKRLRNIAAQLQDDLHNEQLGKEAWVLPEKIETNGFKARSEHYLTVKVLSENVNKEALLGHWLKVKYCKLEDGQLIAKAL